VVVALEGQIGAARAATRHFTVEASACHPVAPAVTRRGHSVNVTPSFPLCRDVNAGPGKRCSRRPARTGTGAASW